MHALLLVIFAMLLAPAVAGANSKIIYVCRPNLCKFDVDTGKRTKLTTDGTPTTRYRAPSLSLDGTKLAFGRPPEDDFRADIYLADGDAHNVVGPLRNGAGERLTGGVTLRPDGSLLGILNSQVENDGQSAVVHYYLSTANLDGSDSRPWVDGRDQYGDLAWGPNGLLSTEGGGQRDHVCELRAPGTGTPGCSRTVALDPGHDLAMPVVSPDGKVVVANYDCLDNGCSDSDRGLEVFKYADASLTRVLTTGSDLNPAFSPDGKEIVFERAGALYVIATDGPAGSERLIVERGEEPTWGAAPGTAPALCVVPKVIGKKLATAKALIKKAGCRVGKVTRKKAAKSKRGRVIRQTPKGGKQIALGSKVKLVVGMR